MTHLVDTSVWHTYQRSAATRTAIARLIDAGALLTTCPVVVAEYCFSARSATELEELQEDMRLLYCLESESLKNVSRQFRHPCGRPDSSELRGQQTRWWLLMLSNTIRLSSPVTQTFCTSSTLLPARNAANSCGCCISVWSERNNYPRRRKRSGRALSITGEARRHSL